MFHIGVLRFAVQNHLNYKLPLIHLIILFHYVNHYNLGILLQSELDLILKRKNAPIYYEWK